MRRILSFFNTTLDGYYEGPDQAFDFWNIDDEFYEFSVEQLGEVDTLAFGRVTYEGMAEYWPTPDARRDSPAIATIMNEIPKIVVSRTLQSADWTNTRLVRAPEDLGPVQGGARKGHRDLR